MTQQQDQQNQDSNKPETANKFLKIKISIVIVITIFVVFIFYLTIYKEQGDQLPIQDIRDIGKITIINDLLEKPNLKKYLHQQARIAGILSINPPLPIPEGSGPSLKLFSSFDKEDYNNYIALEDSQIKTLKKSGYDKTFIIVEGKFKYIDSGYMAPSTVIGFKVEDFQIYPTISEKQFSTILKNFSELSFKICQNGDINRLIVNDNKILLNFKNKSCGYQWLVDSIKAEVVQEIKPPKSKESEEVDSSKVEWFDSEKELQRYLDSSKPD